MKVELSCVIVAVAISAVAGCCENELPEVWNEHQTFNYAVYRLGVFANSIELRALSGKSLQMNMHEISGILGDSNEFVYFYPAKYGPGPFDLIWVGPNGRLEEGRGDDVPIWAIAERLRDEENTYRWWAEHDLSTKAQMFYEEWRKRVLDTYRK